MYILRITENYYKFDFLEVFETSVWHSGKKALSIDLFTFSEQCRWAIGQQLVWTTNCSVCMEIKWQLIFLKFDYARKRPVQSQAYRPRASTRKIMCRQIPIQGHTNTLM